MSQLSSPFPRVLLNSFAAFIIHSTWRGDTSFTFRFSG